MYGGKHQVVHKNLKVPLPSKWKLIGDLRKLKLMYHHSTKIRNELYENLPLCS